MSQLYSCYGRKCLCVHTKLEEVFISTRKLPHIAATACLAARGLGSGDQALAMSDKSRSRSRSKSRSRSRSPARGGGGRDSPTYGDFDETKKARGDDEEATETMNIDHSAAAFVLGKGGSTKRKIERVSECRLDLDEKRGTIELRGTKVRRDRARDYVNFVDQQRTGAVVVETDGRDDLTVVAVPEDCCGFVMGRQGNTLRTMEEEWGTLMCFAKVDDREKLCIFGNFRARHGCELKIMSAIEHKRPGHCVDGDQLLFDKRIPSDQNEDGWDVDTKLLANDDFAYALGAKGSTRRKLAKASGCVIEYVGRLACMAGYRKERIRANEYLRWLLQQRTSQMDPIEIDDREDVTAMDLPSA